MFSLCIIQHFVEPLSYVFCKFPVLQCTVLFTRALNQVSLSSKHICAPAHTHTHTHTHTQALKLIIISVSVQWMAVLNQDFTLIHVTNTQDTHTIGSTDKTTSQKTTTGCDFNGKFTHKTSLLPCTPEYNSFTLSSQLMLHNSKANSASIINKSKLCTDIEWS